MHLPDHPQGGDGAHAVSFASGSLLRRVHGARSVVNSQHHQAIDRPGAGVVCVGHAPDGVVEAVELPGRHVVGVQWHPEQLGRPDPVFDWLVAAAISAAGRVPVR